MFLIKIWFWRNFLSSKQSNRLFWLRHTQSKHAISKNLSNSSDVWSKFQRRNTPTAPALRSIYPKNLLWSAWANRAEIKIN